MPQCQAGDNTCQVGTNKSSGFSWFPEYEPEVEENEKRKWCNWIMMWWICALIVGSIVCGLFVMKPGIVFLRFDEGQCSLNQMKFMYTKSCGCGKNCKSEFPCYSISGTFDNNLTEATDPTEMQLYNSYWSWVKGCSFHTCGKDVKKNYDEVHKQIIAFFEKYGYDVDKIKQFLLIRRNSQSAPIQLDANKKFFCWGDDLGAVFMTYIDSAMQIGVSCIPIVLFFVVAALFKKYATPGMKIVTLRCVCLPYYCVTDSSTTTRYLCNHYGPCGKGYCCYGTSR